MQYIPAGAGCLGWCLPENGANFEASPSPGGGDKIAGGVYCLAHEACNDYAFTLDLTLDTDGPGL